MTTRAWPVWAPGAWLAGFMKGTTKHCYILNMFTSCWPHGFKDFLGFSHYKSMGANDPRGLASLNLRGLIRRINEGDH